MSFYHRDKMAKQKYKKLLDDYCANRANGSDFFSMTDQEILLHQDVFKKIGFL